jgi:salicylate hydroxylase
MKKKIAIIGAGVGGLTLANLLQNNSNFKFIIYEKKETLNLDEGFGIQLAVNSISVLNQIGFKSLNKSEFFNPAKLDFYSNQNKICDLDLTQFNTDTEKYTTLKRSSLIKILKGKLFSNLIRFNKTIKSVEQNQNYIKINFTDGETDEVDYLVVSDGVFSSTKSIIENKNHKPDYYGAVAVRTIVNRKEVKNFDRNNISLLMSAKAHAVLYAINEKEHNLVTIIRSKITNFEKINNLDFIKTILENSILKNIHSLTFLFEKDLASWPIYISNKPTISKFKNVFYLGDAFHTLPPTMAQGASQSIEGAMELFKIFEKDINDKQNLYFNTRLNRTEKINKRSNFNYFVFHLSNKFFVRFRNILIKRLINNKKFIKNYLGRVFRK